MFQFVLQFIIFICCIFMIFSSWFWIFFVWWRDLECKKCWMYYWLLYLFVFYCVQMWRQVRWFDFGMKNFFCVVLDFFWCFLGWKKMLGMESIEMMVIIFLLQLYCFDMIRSLVREGFMGKVFIFCFRLVSLLRLFRVFSVYRLNKEVVMVFWGGGFIKLKLSRFLMLRDLRSKIVLFRLVF